MTTNLTANVYMLGKLKLDGLTKWGEIHTALRYNYSHVKGYTVCVKTVQVFGGFVLIPVYLRM